MVNYQYNCNDFSANLTGGLITGDDGAPTVFDLSEFGTPIDALATAAESGLDPADLPPVDGARDGKGDEAADGGELGNPARPGDGGG